jgi:hypothetical protein
VKPTHPVQRVAYTTKRGERRVYEYRRRPWPTAVDQCLAALAVQPLRRDGKAHWTAGNRGRRFNNATIEKAVARGLAVREGDTIRLLAKHSET